MLIPPRDILPSSSLYLFVICKNLEESKGLGNIKGSIHPLPDCEVKSGLANPPVIAVPEYFCPYVNEEPSQSTITEDNCADPVLSSLPMKINLLSNAIAYSGNNIEIEINYLARNENEVEFYIKDYGAGIPEESVDRLTERFYRIDKGRSREHGGTGLGLSIVKHIMNRHDGKLEIESAINEGSKFTCVFPKT